MVNYVRVKTVPDSTKLRRIKGPKFPEGACPRTPLVRHMLCTCPPLGQKAERNPVGCHPLNKCVPLQHKSKRMPWQRKPNTMDSLRGRRQREKQERENTEKKFKIKEVKLVTIIMISYHTIATGLFSPSFEPLGVRFCSEKNPIAVVW